jgi:lysophospholipase L1-like esterase
MFLFPYESQVLGGLDQRELQTRLETACAARGIACLDLAATFRAHALAQIPPAELFLRGDRYHPNRDGYALVAAGLVRLVESP